VTDGKQQSNTVIVSTTRLDELPGVFFRGFIGSLYDRSVTVKAGESKSCKTDYMLDNVPRRYKK